MAEIISVARATLNGKLPARYYESWLGPIFTRAESTLFEGARILDIGSGRRPVLIPENRPDNCHYVGLDVSREELELAATGSYNELVVADASTFTPYLANSFDLIISTQVFEHVKPLDKMVENLNLYLRPGGTLISQFSGTFAAFAIANRIFPSFMSQWFLGKLVDRHSEVQPIFEAAYHKCWHSALNKIFRSWSQVEITPRYLAAKYFAFSKPLQAIYIAYEQWSLKHPNLASYYLVTAKK